MMTATVIAIGEPQRRTFDDCVSEVLLVAEPALCCAEWPPLDSVDQHHHADLRSHTSKGDKPTAEAIDML